MGFKKIIKTAPQNSVVGSHYTHIQAASPEIFRNHATPFTEK